MHERSPPAAVSAVEIRADAVRLQGELALPAQASGIVLFAHGSGSSRHSPRNTYVARVLREAGLGTLLFDLLTGAEDRDYATRFDIPLLTSRLVAATALDPARIPRRRRCRSAISARAPAPPPRSRPRRRSARASARSCRAAAGPIWPARLRCARVTAPTLLIVGGRDEAVIELNREAYAQLGRRQDDARRSRRHPPVRGARHARAGGGRAADWFARWLGAARRAEDSMARRPDHRPVRPAARRSCHRRSAGARRLAEAWPEARHGLVWDPIRASVDCWSWFSRLGDIWWTRAAGAAAIAAASRNRFDALVRFARERSPFYRDAYRGLPAGRLDPAALPVVTKRALMASLRRLGDGSGTRAGRRHRVPRGSRAHRRALSRPLRDLEELGKHRRTGDLRAGRRCAGDLRRADGRASRSRAIRRRACLAHRGARRAGGPDRRDRRSLRQHRVVATAHPEQPVDRGARLLDHGSAAAAGCANSMPISRPSSRAIRRMLALLADERKAGRLEIDPASLWSGGECLPAPARAEIEAAFALPGRQRVRRVGVHEHRLRLRRGLAARQRRLGAARAGRRRLSPTPPGEPSRTVLLTNLANRVQPIIRYDLGDSVVVKPEPCACGSPLPAIEVEGRHDDVLSLVAPDGAHRAPAAARAHDGRRGRRAAVALPDRADGAGPAAPAPRVPCRCRPAGSLARGGESAARLSRPAVAAQCARRPRHARTRSPTGAAEN